MSVVYDSADSPGTTLLKHKRELRIQYPHLNEAEDRFHVAQKHPNLVRLHHAGLNAEPEATVDPGMVLQEIADRRLANHQASTSGEAFAQAAKLRPDLYEAWNRAERVPADQAHRAPEPDPPARQLADPGLELARLVTLRLQAEPTLSVEQAQRAVLTGDPVLAEHYSDARPLPLGPRPTARERTVEQALAQAQQTAAELQRLSDQLAAARRQMTAPPARLHVATLSPAEQRRHLPEGRLAPGEPLRPGETRVEKMGDVAHGGGSFAVQGA